MFDMGPYYLTALLNLLGPVKRDHRLRVDEPADANDRPQATTITSEREVREEDQRRDARPCRRHDGVRERRGRHDHPELRDALRASTIGTAADHASSAPTARCEVPGPEPVRRPRPRAPVDEAKDEYVEVPHAFVAGYGRSVGLADMAYAIRVRPPAPLQRGAGVRGARPDGRGSMIRPQRLAAEHRSSRPIRIASGAATRYRSTEGTENARSAFSASVST